MQIIGGKYRHRLLHSSPGEITRPITARVKVALFDRLQPRLQDARIADIYAGTGTIGLEALSRGARSVVFFEQDRVAFDMLKQNVAELKVEEETICWRTDATKSSFRPQGGDEFVPYDVLFFDPPYKHIQGLKPGTMLYKSLIRLARPAVSVPEALLVVRCRKHSSFEMPAVWKLEQLLQYSSMHVYLYRNTSTATVEGEVSESSPEADSDSLPSDVSEA